MRYAQIRSMDISNGEGVGVALFVQGCPFHCKGCFNQETWNYSGGEAWTPEVEDQFMKLVNRPYITRVSILGGEPLSECNLAPLTCLLMRIKKEFPEKAIWLYTGYILENIFSEECRQRIKLLTFCDVVVDGPFIEELKDLSLDWRGSSNQRVIKMKDICGDL